jgi:hypothetical protein
MSTDAEMGMTDREIVAAVIDQVMRQVAPMLDRMEQRLSRIGELAAIISVNLPQQPRPMPKHLVRVVRE